MKQLEIEYCSVPELDNVKKAISYLEEVKAELEEGKEFTLSELWEIHNQAVKIGQHGLEMRFRAARNMGKMESTRDRNL